MRCEVCGREAMNPEANYCDYCGTSFREAGFRAEIKKEQEAPGQKTAATGGQVPMLWFLGVMCLPFVPVIGAFAYLGVLFYWSFSDQIQDSRKSFGRATLIFTAALVVLLMMMMPSLEAFLAGDMSALTGMFSGQ